ncbi:major capsid protein [Candidatus Colimorpha enterica]|uniref:Major capsid protein n=1 Tax=Candidatus Colimorpha enterica TaxID=3083063 RepID=R6V5H4_9BACT|nr:major capsid protein [Candidatus Colimorpha enterica]
MEELNYAKVYSDRLAQAFPYTLNFGALYATPNNGRYRFRNGKTIELPVINTTGRTDVDRDSISAPGRNYENMWEEKPLTNQRKWSTLIHPQDIDQTDYAASISNITQVFNNEHKFPEMDAYTVSKIYRDFTALGLQPLKTEVTADNVLSLFDDMMANMTDMCVPVCGRVLYVTPAVMKLLKSSASVSRSLDVRNCGGEVNRTVTVLDGVSVVEVPSSLMKTVYDFTDGWKPAKNAEQIEMLLIHPESVITPVSYEFACLDEPSASTGGKYVYYEESFEDVFILNNRSDGISFVVKPASGT